jgi:hypothetical protein
VCPVLDEEVYEGLANFVSGQFFGQTSRPDRGDCHLHRKDGGTLVSLAHEVPDDPSWEKMVETFRENWVSSLENLKSVLETGIDLRIANRPMLGIVPGDFTPEQAKAWGPGP